MLRHRRSLSIAISLALSTVAATTARPADTAPQVTTADADDSRVDTYDGTGVAPQKALQDTLWIVNWTFDTGTPCSSAGWTHQDAHVLNDGVVHWHLESGFTTPTGMQGQSAAVGYHDNLCCSDTDGYANDWYQALRLTYTGAATLSLDYIVDSEPHYDFLQVETDSLCLSFARVDFDTDPWANAAAYRTYHVWADGSNTIGEWNAVPLVDHGPGTHCVYIAFYSDGGYSPCDGVFPTTVGEAAVIDNIVLVDASGTRTEDFEDGTLDIGTFVNIGESVPFGTWARLYSHVSDNDACTENTSCAWLWSDHTTPTLFSHPSMSFGPGGYVVKNWLDDTIVSPWVSLGNTPGASGTVLAFRRFGGNAFSAFVVQNWSVRGRHDVGGQLCSGNWGHASNWNSLSDFHWRSWRYDMTPYFGAGVDDIQVRFRVSDWQRIADTGPPSSPIHPGPGPYLDDVRIGRVVLSGPVIDEGIDARSQAQDCFPTEIHPGVTPAGEHHRPTTDRFGTCAFSQGTDITRGNSSPNLVTGDSIHVSVRGVRPGGTVVTTVIWHGAIVRGPHVNKAPAPYVVGANGFFSLAADSVRTSGGTVIADNYCVDLDDTYFRGGDVLVYFWSATDAGGGFSTDPPGMSALPVSVPAAEAATGGLLEVSFLPKIHWSSSYLARIASDAHGDLEPTPTELANSVQANCVLYVNHVDARRRTGKMNRTDFMYVLDQVAMTFYDVYDHTGMGNTNNHLGGRATVEQAQGYALIIYDTGDRDPGRPLVPDGTELDASKVDQGGWFQDWLAQSTQSEVGIATVWMIGANLLEEHPTLPLYTSTMGVSLVANNQGMGINPEVLGVSTFTFDLHELSVTHDFTGDEYVAQGGCPTVRTFDALGTSGTAVQTHRYRSPATGALGGGAIVMNSNAAENWNTLLMSHALFDIRDPTDGPPLNASQEKVLVATILGTTLPVECIYSIEITDTGEQPDLDLPRRTALHQNVPNPFNPVTTIRFDLARGGKVALRIYDVAGRLVRTLVDGEIHAGRDHAVVWDGLDVDGRPAASGVYFYRLDTPDAHLSRRMILMK